MVIFWGQSVNGQKFIFCNTLQFFSLPVQHGFDCDIRCSSLNCQTYNIYRYTRYVLGYVTSSTMKSLKKYLSTQAMRRNFLTINNHYGSQVKAAKYFVLFF